MTEGGQRHQRLPGCDAINSNRCSRRHPLLQIVAGLNGDAETGRSSELESHRFATDEKDLLNLQPETGASARDILWWCAVRFCFEARNDAHQVRGCDYSRRRLFAVLQTLWHSPR